MDQNSLRNNKVVDSITCSVNKRELEDKCIKFWGKIDIKVDESDIEVCHRLGKSFKTVTLFGDKCCSKIIAK